MVSDAARMPHIVAAPDIASGADIVVLGLGNTLRRDEGLGIHALERLRIDYTFSPAPLFVDGGTLGLELISYLEDAERILILDADRKSTRLNSSHYSRSRMPSSA